MKKILVEIDKTSKIGKQIIPLLMALSENNPGISILTQNDTEDRILGIMMTEAAKSGLAAKKRVLSKLGINY